MVLVLLIIAVAICLYLKALSKDSTRLTVNNISIQIPKSLNYITSGYNVYFYKPKGKHELHAFTSTRNFDSEPEVYLGKMSPDLTHSIFEAVRRGGANYGFVNEITNTGRLLIFHQTCGSYSKNVWGFIEKGDLKHIERDFKKDFNLELIKGEGGREYYRVGVTPKAPEKIEEEEQLREWCRRLEAWWERKANGETIEDFEGLQDTSLTLIHRYLYKRVTDGKGV